MFPWGFFLMQKSDIRLCDPEDIADEFDNLPKGVGCFLLLIAAASTLFFAWVACMCVYATFFKQ